jgi:hypothetical protein
MQPEDWQSILETFKREFEGGRVKIHDRETLEALKRVRSNADGTVNLDTVDPRVRSLALAVFASVEQRQLKSTPLLDTQRGYFDTLAELFGEAYDWMTENGLTSHEAASALCSDEDNVSLFRRSATALPAALERFWSQSGPVIDAHLQDSKTLKVVYGGDVFPLYGTTLTSAIGMYADTLILPDPLQRAAMLFESAQPELASHFLVKHALTALSLRELALADVDPPILVLGPNAINTHEYAKRLIVSQSEDDLVGYCEEMFGRSFSKGEELTEFCESITNPQELVKNLAKPERLVFDVERPGEPQEVIREHLEFEARSFRSETLATTVGETVRHGIFGRMLSTNELLFRSAELQGTPVIEAPTSWQYLQWKYEHDAQRSRDAFSISNEILINKALQAQGSPVLRLLCRVTPQALIDLRKQGAMSELRRIIRDGISEIDHAPARRLAVVTEKVSRNLEAALGRHIDEVRRLRRQRAKFFGLEVAPFVGAAAIQILAAMALHPVAGLLAAGVEIAGVSNARELWKRAREHAKEHQQASRTPAAILYRHARSAQRAAKRRLGKRT